MRGWLVGQREGPSSPSGSLESQKAETSSSVVAMSAG